MGPSVALFALLGQTTAAPLPGTRDISPCTCANLEEAKAGPLVEHVQAPTPGVKAKRSLSSQLAGSANLSDEILRALPRTCCHLGKSHLICVGIQGNWSHPSMTHTVPPGTQLCCPGAL